MIDYVIDIRRMLYPDEDTPEVSKTYIIKILLLNLS